jgi:cyclopropane-fatty-acyl-phospholipid synthase
MGCGWGSFTLWAAKLLPKSKITAISNSKDQTDFIREQCKARDLRNVTVIKCDINELDKQTQLAKQFDRIVSIEMLEHAKNYDKAFALLSSMLKVLHSAFGCSGMSFSQ